MESTQTVNTWKWVWSDYGDEILASQQIHTSNIGCQIDGFRHLPGLRSSEMKGRTGKPILQIKESAAIQYRWVFTFYDDNEREVGRYAQSRWYETMSECIYASRNVELADTNFHYETDFESRVKKNPAVKQESASPASDGHDTQ